MRPGIVHRIDKDTSGLLIVAKNDRAHQALAAQLAINPNTIQRAYTELERQGYIYSIKGKGSFVADNSRMKAGILQEWKGHFNSAVEEGIKVGVTAGEMKEMIDTACRNHAMERGESND